MLYKGFIGLLSLFIAGVFIQSLFFKFTDAYETLHIFGVLGAWSGFQWFADYGAYGVGTVELIASILLFTRLRMYGAALASCVMAGAVYFHLCTPLGVAMPVFDEVGNVVGDDDGLLFYLACGLLIAGLVITVLEFIRTDNRGRRKLFG